MPSRRPTHGLEWYVTHGWGQSTRARTTHTGRVRPSEGGVTPHRGSGTVKRQRRVVVVRRRAHLALGTSKRQGRSGGNVYRVRVVVERQRTQRAASHASATPHRPVAPHHAAAHHHAMVHHHPAAPHHHRPRVSRRR
jgi:hypothetical protein